MLLIFSIDRATRVLWYLLASDHSATSTDRSDDSRASLPFSITGGTQFELDPRPNG